MYTFRDIKVDNKYKITYLLSLFVYIMLCLFMCLSGSLCNVKIHLGNNKYINEHIVRYLTDKISIT